MESLKGLRPKLIILIVIGAVIGIGLAVMVGGVNLPLGAGPEKLFSVKRGQGLFEIAGNLEKEGLIKNRLFFNAAVFLLDGSKRLQAGDYYLSPKMTPLEIAEKIIDGEVAKETITILEGWNLKETNSYLKSQGLFKGQEFLTAASRDHSVEFAFLKDKPAQADLEGYLFPDTYELESGGTAEDLVAKMLKNFGDKLTPELRTEIERQKKKVFEIVTLASLLEKEAKTIEDKKIVSGILWKRLRVGMRLQVDATIIYALGINPGQITYLAREAKISYEQTKTDSPYNTYRFAGLPLGPIANPGLDSLKAAIYLQESDYWYYLATPAGQTLFSRTLEEHNVKKVKYLK